ncbi:hypothetical protein [Saccharibacillus sacchari]|uniref:Uncharacterized protein n=1 Tax=Saccharibacillus sacchari TaxID=456493 RepID=A0ACC6P5W9_9BACL
MKRICSIAFIIFISFYGFQNSVHAEPNIEYADDTVTAAIQTDFEDHYVNSLNADDQQFQTSLDFSDAKLGEGIAVYQIEIEDQSFTFKGYEFPLTVGNEVVGTVEAEQNAGKWSIFNISTLAELPSDLQEAQRQAGTDSNIQYVHDKRYKIKGFHIQNSEQEIFFDSNEKEVYDINSFNQSIEAFRTQQSNLQMKGSSNNGEIQVGGGIELLDHSASSAFPFVKVAIATVFLAAGLILLRQIRRNKR